MRIILLILLLPCSVLAGNQGDSTYVQGKIYLGFEVLQNIVPAIIPHQYPLHKTLVFEPTLFVRTNFRQNLITLSPGYTFGKITYPEKLTSAQSFRGYSIKATYETPSSKWPLSIGFGPVMSLTTFHGTNVYRGATFGDYTAPYVHKNVFTGGLMGMGTARVHLTKGMFLRIMIHGALSLRTEAIPSYYLPGAGFSTNTGALIPSVGASCQLMFRVK